VEVFVLLLLPVVGGGVAEEDPAAERAEGVGGAEAVPLVAAAVVVGVVVQRAQGRTLLDDRTIALDDKVSRALGLLRNARLMASDETLLLLSHLRMGVNLGRVKDIDIRTINELFLLTQPAHLQKIQGRKLEGDVRRAARADYIRQRLGGA